MKLAGEFLIIALVALALTALPGGNGALNATLTLLSVAFFTAIAFMGARLYGRFSYELDSLGERGRLVLYSSIGLAFLTFAATNRLFDAGGLGALAWIALLGLASYGVYWVYRQYRTA